ncbi:jg2449 [Pararge aegeria aegeria]|uniref:Jg2449 protein n=1 Tax=Pararge aegeria aegeria TaxID=348720 RepID=A0A8S4RZN6_9NEOP|nr:jg2449 [Pararge aegeria aegeria]
MEFCGETCPGEHVKVPVLRLNSFRSQSCCADDESEGEESAPIFAHTVVPCNIGRPLWHSMAVWSGGRLWPWLVITLPTKTCR